MIITPLKRKQEKKKYNNPGINKWESQRIKSLNKLEKIIAQARK